MCLLTASLVIVPRLKSLLLSLFAVCLSFLVYKLGEIIKPILLCWWEVELG